MFNSLERHMYWEFDESFPRYWSWSNNNLSIIMPSHEHHDVSNRRQSTPIAIYCRFWGEVLLSNIVWGSTGVGQHWSLKWCFTLSSIMSRVHNRTTTPYGMADAPAKLILMVSRLKYIIWNISAIKLHFILFFLLLHVFTLTVFIIDPAIGHIESEQC